MPKPSIEKLMNQVQKAKEKAKQYEARISMAKAKEVETERKLDRSAKPILGGMVVAAIRAGRITPDQAWKAFGPAARSDRERWLVRRLLGFRDEDAGAPAGPEGGASPN